MGTVYRRFITATATLFLFLTTAHLQEVKPSGIFEFSLVSFENREGRDYLDSGCCSGRPGADGLCPPCPVFLRVCVKHYQVNVDPATTCTFHEFITPLLQPFNGTEEVQGLQGLDDKQSKMAFDLDFAWPGQFSLIVEAWHPNEGKGSNKVLVARFIAQRTLKIGLDWTQDRLYTNKSSLKIMYRVYCARNYYGPTCQELCRSRNDKFGHYTCREDGQKLCNPGWTGSYCDKALCLSGCHPTHGTCSNPNECICRYGWEGDLCDTCRKYPGCLHGTCITPWQCNCDEGWGGLICDQDLNYCTNHKPCENGGTCTNTGQGSYTCSCTDDFVGKNCDKLKNPCQMNPCKNGGICQNSEEGEYICECAPRFFGQNCETKSSICLDNPCDNGGSCIVQTPTVFTCSCLPGYSGKFCDKKVSTGCKTGYYCSNGGTCEELPNGPRCKCPQGLSGIRCETIDTCSFNTCKNGGTCDRHPSTGQLLCSCPSGFSGRYCEVQVSQCALNPCANGGECQDHPDGYFCDCKPGFSGENCSVKLSSYCSSSPCLNGAFCHDTANGFSCQCLNGYRGNRCQYKEVNSSMDINRQSSVASNVSHRVSFQEESQSLSGKQVALIASLSSVLPIFVIVLCCVICCTLRKRKQQKHADESPKAKECDFDIEDEQLQNERNTMHMNNKQCNIPQKIVNTLDRLPAKVSNEAPPKVLNIEVSNQKVLDKSLVCTQRTLQKKDNTYGSSISGHISQDWPSSHGTGIYVIEDHFRSCPEVGPKLELENILATEV